MDATLTTKLPVKSSSRGDQGNSDNHSGKSRMCDKAMASRRESQSARRFSTEIVDNFVDNLALCFGDAVQSRLLAKCLKIGH